MDKILSILKRTEALAGMVLLIGYFLVSNFDLRCERNNLRESNLILHNELADKDSLKQVLGDTVNVLSERLARQEENLNSVVGQRSLLAKRLKEKEGEALAVAEMLAEARLENIKIRGTVDSTGYKADFSDINEYYTIRASVNLKPVPVMDLHELSIWDSSSVALYSVENGYVYGVIERSNPYIKDLGASFYIPIGEQDTGGIRLEWYEIAGGTVAVALLTWLAAK